MIWPIPVVEIDGCFYAADSMCVIAALASEDPDFLLRVRLVNRVEAWAIRHGHHRKQFAKEPMAHARRALLMTRAGFTLAAIAEIIGCNESRVSQLVPAAKREEQFRELKSIIVEPERIPARFWEEFHATICSRQDLDEKDPLQGKPSRIEEFTSRARGLVKSGEMLGIDKVRTELDLIELGKPRRRRGRKLGDPHDIAGSKLKLFIARDRAGGTAINLPQELDSDFVEEVIKAVVSMIAASSTRRKRNIKTDSGRDGRQGG